MTENIVLQIFKAFAGAFQARAAGRRARADLYRQAGEVKRVGKDTLDDFTRETSALLGRQRALQGGAGLAMTGSPLAVDEATVRQVAIGRQRIMSDTGRQVFELQEQARRVRRDNGFARSFARSFLS